MKAITADERGRITLGTKITEKFGGKFVVVSTEKEIVLIPVAEEPIKELQQIGKKARIDSYSIKELKKIAEEEAEKESQKRLKKDVR